MMGLAARGLYGYGGHMFGRGFGAPLMFLVWGLFLLGVVLLIVWAARSRHHALRAYHHGTAAAPTAGPDDALQIARTRLAKGEITPEEYDRILPLLR